MENLSGLSLGSSESNDVSLGGNGTAENSRGNGLSLMVAKVRKKHRDRGGDGKNKRPNGGHEIQSSILRNVPSTQPVTGRLKLEVKSRLQAYWKFYRRDFMFRKNTSMSWKAADNMLPLDEATPQLNPG